MKKCFKCKKLLSLTAFYVHIQMRDGHLNKCILCTKKDVNRRYYDPKNRKKIIEYEKLREKNLDRKVKKLIYQRNRRKKNKGKDRARAKVLRALNVGRLIKRPCEICGNLKVEAHHNDYRKHLSVRWLCRYHHMITEGKIPYHLK